MIRHIHCYWWSNKRISQYKRSVGYSAVVFFYVCYWELGVSRLGGPWWLDPCELRRILIGCQAGLEEPWPSGAKGPGVPGVIFKLRFVCRGNATFRIVCLYVPDRKVCMVGRRAQRGWGQSHQTTLGLVKEVTGFICILLLSKNKRLIFPEPIF